MAFRKSKIKPDWNDEFAYVIGVIATDGNLANNLRHIRITSKDLEMVNNCRKILKIENKISRNSRGQSKGKQYYMLQFGDRNFFDFLLSLGLTPSKSKTISELKLPTQFFPSFLLGCIDGDGSISISKHPESSQLQYKLRICSASNKFLEWILKMSHILFKIKGGSISKGPKSSIYTLTFGKNDSIRILKMIYFKNMLCLSRKRKIAMKILGRVA